jgi:cation:H+ antiporter
MLTIISLSFLAITFFFILSHGADLLVGNLRALADRSKVHPVLLGIMLGFLTTIPEFMVGINAARQGVLGISLGNIWGGNIVILALILGLSIVLQRQIKTDGRLLVVLPSFIFILFSLFLGLKGVLHYYDGLLLVVFYLIIVYLDFFSWWTLSV